MRLPTAVLTSLALATSPRSAAHAQAAPSPSAAILQRVAPRFSGKKAKETVAVLDRYVRWPGNRGFDVSITHLVDRLEKAGFVRQEASTPADRLVFRVEHYPMVNPAWEPRDASVEIEGEHDRVLQFRTNRNMLATNSWSTPDTGVVADVVDLGAASAAAFDSINVAGRIFMADAGVGRLFAESVRKRGALGVLDYSMPAYTQPDRNVHSIQFAGIPYDTTSRGWAIALSADARQRLRAALARGRVRLRVRTDVAWTPNAVEQTIVAEVLGSRRPEERFVFNAHVQEPGANDNASGVGTQMEMARVAADLLTGGDIGPKRTITFLWGLEIRSTDRYISQDSVRAAGIKWGLSLDMVGEDTRKTGGTFLIEKMPDPSAVWTRGQDKHTEWGGSALTKEQLTPHYFNDLVLARCLELAATNGWVVKTNPFEDGSDHTPFLRAKKPGLLFWHFTDQFYHTDGDRLDMVSADEMKNVGISALVSALFLTSADGHGARAAVNAVARAAVERLAVERALSDAALAQGGDAAHERDILERLL